MPNDPPPWEIVRQQARRWLRAGCFEAWAVERSFAWAARFRRLDKDRERSARTRADLHIVAFASFMLKKVAKLAQNP